MTEFLYNNSQFLKKDTSFCLKKPRFPASAVRISSFSPVKSVFASGCAAPRAISTNPEPALFKKLSSFVCGKSAVVACVGTDLVGGDCLGPLVGQLLVEANAPAFIYGTLQTPITALNVEETRDFISLTHPGRLVIAVDSAVGSKNEEGLISVTGGPLRPGLALGKQLGALGDVSVTVVTSAHSPEKKEFSAVRLGFVYNLARRVAGLILSCLQQY